MTDSILLFIMFILYHVYIQCYGNYIDCTYNYCQWGTVDCRDNETCTVSCTTSYGCQGATINCPTNGSCIVQCTADSSCRSAIINGKNDQPLNVSCTGTHSCEEAVFNGAIDADTNILCAKDYACYQATFDGRYSSMLRLLDCATDSFTCTEITVWCPANINGQKRCIIQGDNSVGGGDNCKWYAINSWNDIDFQTPIKDNYFSGTMYCTTGILIADYSKNCNIDQYSGWRCYDTTSICQHPPTYSPTNNPTKIPSINPTINPSINPSQNPSKTPSVYPTLSPNTPIPTSIPTFLPTPISTKTLNPINNPTISPTVKPSNGESLIITIPESTMQYEQITKSELITTTTYHINTVEKNQIVQKIVSESHSQYFPYISIGVILIIFICCIECCYCFCWKKSDKKQSKKTTQLHPESKERDLQMISNETTAASILPAPPSNPKVPTTTCLLTKEHRHYKNTASHSVLSVEDIWQQATPKSNENIMEEFGAVRTDILEEYETGMDGVNDMEIIGSDEFNKNAIITKRETFEDPENDQEIMSTKMFSLSNERLLSEGDKHRYYERNNKVTITEDDDNETIGDIDDYDNDSINTPFGIDLDDKELNHDAIITMDAPITFGGSFDEIHAI